MADYTKSRKFGQTFDGTQSTGTPTKGYPINALETTSLFKRIEPIITPSLLISRYLKGVDLTDYTTDELKDRIEQGIAEAEVLLGTYIYPVQFKERLPFDRDLYRSFIHITTNEKPILSVDKLIVESSNGENIFEIPPDWIEVGYAAYGQINVLPILRIFGSSGLVNSQASNVGLVFIQAVSNFQWVPAFWTIHYTAGICREEGQVPLIINEIIGLTVAINILNVKQAQNKFLTTSISQDGISQTSTTPGPTIYQRWIDNYISKRENLIRKVKKLFVKNFDVGTL